VAAAPEAAGVRVRQVMSLGRALGAGQPPLKIKGCECWLFSKELLLPMADNLGNLLHRLVLPVTIQEVADESSSRGCSRPVGSYPTRPLLHAAARRRHFTGSFSSDLRAHRAPSHPT